MVTRLWLLRHGPTHEKSFLGWRDVPADLSDVDRIARLSASLPDDALVVASDLLRARQTADAIEGGRQRLADSAELREFNFGVWDGLGFSEVADRDPQISRMFWEDPGDVAPPQGESWNQVANRVTRFIADLTTEHEGRDIVVVAHIGAIMTQIGGTRGLDARRAISHQIDPLSVTRIDVSADESTLVSVNHCP